MRDIGFRVFFLSGGVFIYGPLQKNCSECVGLLCKREELETFKGLFQVIFLFQSLVLEIIFTNDILWFLDSTVFAALM